MSLLNHDCCYIISFAGFNQIGRYPKHIPLISVVYFARNKAEPVLGSSDVSTDIRVLADVVTVIEIVAITTINVFALSHLFRSMLLHCPSSFAAMTSFQECTAQMPVRLQQNGAIYKSTAVQIKKITNMHIGKKFN
jgi:hypothetical protein